MNILFNGGAVWGFCEYTGTLQYIREHHLTFDRVYGVSAGAGIAALYVLGIEMPDIMDMWNNALANTKVGDSLTINHIMGCKFLFSKCPNAYKLANNRLFIGITGKHGFFWKSAFNSNRDLGNALICGGTIPLLSSYTAKIKNQYAIDGGIGISASDIPKNTIVVSSTMPFPFSVLPPSPHVQYLLRTLGYYKMKQKAYKATCLNPHKLDQNIVQLLFFIQEHQLKHYSKHHIED
jgi:hypothetical protein